MDCQTCPILGAVSDAPTETDLKNSKKKKGFFFGRVTMKADLHYFTIKTQIIIIIIIIIIK